jgi:5-formyltetrahydrofolate cyclo-ligase
MYEKAELRNSMLSRREALAPVAKSAMDERICDKLKQLVDDLKPQVVHTYIPMGAEVDVKPFIQYLLAKEITILAPKVLPKRQLQHLVLTNLEHLEDGSFGTVHPAGDEKYEGNIDLFIVPGLVFSEDQYRIGYGGGYYDKMLTSYPNAYKAGICYSFQLLKKIPVEPHDVQLDGIIVE